MTQDDAFDARLTAMFAAAEAQIAPDPGMTRRVMGRIARVQRLRTGVIGLVGALGAAGAAVSLRNLMASASLDTSAPAGLIDAAAIQVGSGYDGFATLAQLTLASGPQTLFFLALAGMALAVGSIAPSRA